MNYPMSVEGETLGNEVIELDFQLQDFINTLETLFKNYSSVFDMTKSNAIITMNVHAYNIIKDLKKSSKYKEEIFFLKDFPNDIPTGIILTHVDISKGLEYQSVIYVFEEIEKYTSLEKSRIYTGLTRASDNLVVLKYLLIWLQSQVEK